MISEQWVGFLCLDNNFAFSHGFLSAIVTGMLRDNLVPRHLKGLHSRQFCEPAELPALFHFPTCGGGYQ